ncbi:hypothetical protein predicted by Glimmer/Critica [Azoarcus olearius]|uniref:Uncharacterized protein n=1 Tax=Azoarcus sp. (strain BH72) TaxID=418699 RepID=A1K2B5_AZOSB|nr:hypothetical protein predicted by Glimmer/Critica [Azoarcus olearius]
MRLMVRPTVLEAEQTSPDREQLDELENSLDP